VENTKYMRLLKIKEMDPIDLISLEESLFELRTKDLIPDTIVISEHKKFLYLCTTTSINCVDLDYGKSCGYPIVRSAILPGGLSSVIVVGTGFSFLIVVKKSNYNIESKIDFMNKFYFDIFQSLMSGVEMEIKGNDFVVKDTERKMMGVATWQNEEYILGNHAFLNTLPTDINLDLLYKLPESKTFDKILKLPSERMTSYEKETNKVFSYDDIFNGVINYLESQSIDCEIGEDFLQIEKDMANGLKEKHLSDEWIKYGQIYAKPDFI